MHLKPKNSFQKSTSEQLDLVDTLDEVKKIKKKRSVIIILLFLTVGLSLSFIIYRRLKNTNFSDIKLPSFNIKLPTIASSKFSPEIPKNWSILVQDIGTTSYNFSSNYTSFNLKNINTLQDPAYAKKYLPDGVVVTEKTNFTKDYLEILSQLSTPKIKFEIYVKIPGTITSTSPEIDLFAKLVSTFYWHLIN